MRTLEAIEQYYSILFGRFIGYLQARDKAGSMPRIDDDTGQPVNWPVERTESGGYNEAYVMHHWASLGPRDR